MLPALLAFVTSIIYVQAFIITQPDSKGWPRNVGMMTVRWNTSPPDPPVFTMLLRDTSQSSVVNPLAVANNVPSSLGSFELNLPTVPVSQTYQILFVDPTNLSRIFATSSVFPITNSPGTTSQTVTQSTFTATLTLSSSASSTLPPTTSLTISSTLSSSTSSGISSITSASSISTSAPTTRMITSTLGTATPGTVTVTVTPDPGASFVPINAAERPRGIDVRVGSLVIFMLSFLLGEL